MSWELHKKTRLVTYREKAAVAKSLYCGFHGKEWARQGKQV